MIQCLPATSELRDDVLVRQLELFDRAQLAAMRDRRRRRNYSAEAEQFRLRGSVAQHTPGGQIRLPRKASANTFNPVTGPVLKRARKVSFLYRAMKVQHGCVWAEEHLGEFVRRLRGLRVIADRRTHAERIDRVVDGYDLWSLRGLGVSGGRGRGLTRRILRKVRS